MNVSRFYLWRLTVLPGGTHPLADIWACKINNSYVHAQFNIAKRLCWKVRLKIIYLLGPRSIAGTQKLTIKLESNCTKCRYSVLNNSASVLLINYCDYSGGYDSQSKKKKKKLYLTIKRRPDGRKLGLWSLRIIIEYKIVDFFRSITVQPMYGKVIKILSMFLHYYVKGFKKRGKGDNWIVDMP